MAAAEAKALDEGWPEIVAIEDSQRPPILLMQWTTRVSIAEICTGEGALRHKYLPRERK